MDAIYTATAETLIAATWLGARRELPPPDRLRSEVLGLLKDMVSRCRAAGIADAETAEARYALVAFLDERILKSSWAGREEWMNNPLQLQLYREFTAGENFFLRLRALLQRPDSPPAIEVYFLCLALGFTGAVSASGSMQDAQSYMKAARAKLPRPHDRVLSPHAVPADHSSVTAPRRPLVWGLVLACTFVVVLGLGLLRWSLGRTLGQVHHDLVAVDVAQNPAPAEN